jgi:hypothetical protein
MQIRIIANTVERSLSLPHDHESMAMADLKIRKLDE